jgi:hypothetical protein
MDRGPGVGVSISGVSLAHFTTVPQQPESGSKLSLTDRNA